MNYVFKENSTPLYIQLYQFLKKDIVNGVYPFNSKLPSKRVIRDETGISIISVEHSLSLLTEEGYIEPRERSGYYVIFKKEDFISSLDTPSEGLTIQIGSSYSGEFPFSVLSKTMRKILLDYGEKIMIKSPNEGSILLREEIKAYLARSRSINVELEQIIIGSGSEYLYGLIAQLSSPDDVFGIENPSYAKIKEVYEASSKNVISLNLGNDGIDTRQLMDSPTTILHVTPFHSYPSGISISATKKHAYLSWAKKNGSLLIEDNYDSELTVSSKEEDSLFALSEDDNVIYLNTFSKTIAPSFRVGYMLLPKHLVPAFKSRLGFYSCTVPTFTQLVISELLRNGDFERHLNRVRRKKRRQLKETKKD